MSYGGSEYTYELVEGWAKYPEGWAFIDIGGLFIDSQDRVHVISRGTHPVMVFDRKGNLLTSWGDGLFNRPHGIFVDHDGFIYCTDDGSHTVYKFTPNGELLLTLGNKDQPSDTGYVKQIGATRDEWVATIKRGGQPFNRPTGVALSPSGVIYVSDGYGNARVHKFAPDGTLLFSWGEPGNAPGQFRTPHGIFIELHKERVWIADRENNRLQIFDSKGKFLSEWTNVKRPQGVWIDDKETVYVAEAGQRISIFNIEGKLLARWGNEGIDDVTALFSAPHAIAVDSKDGIYVGEVSMARLGIDRGPRALQKFARKS